MANFDPDDFTAVRCSVLRIAEVMNEAGIDRQHIILGTASALAVMIGTTYVEGYIDEFVDVLSATMKSVAKTAHAEAERLVSNPPIN